MNVLYLMDVTCAVICIGIGRVKLDSFPYPSFLAPGQECISSVQNNNVVLGTSRPRSDNN